MVMDYFVLLCLSFLSLQIWEAQGTWCEQPQNHSGILSYSTWYQYTDYDTKCWYIEPEEDGVIHLSIEELKLGDPYCDSAYIEIEDDNGRTERICQYDSMHTDNGNWMKTFFGAVNVSLTVRNAQELVQIKLRYAKGDSVIRVRAINWLKKHQSNFGCWGRNTHRAITALYLADAAQFRGNKMEEELMVKQLQLKLATELLRNATDPMSVNELSMYVNALTVTCHNDRNIFSKDLLKILADRAFSAASPCPGAYLTLCNAHWPFTISNIQTLLDHLEKDIEYQFRTEIQAMTVLALSCIQNRTELFDTANNSYILGEAVENLMENQQDDGSFGNPHTTAIVTQALIASGQEYNSTWNVTDAMQFLMNQLNSSSVDFLSVYLTLPLLSGKTLADIGRVHCEDNYRKLDEDDDILGVIDKLGGSNPVQYSLYIGDFKDVVHTIYLRVPDNSTAYDVMKIARLADPKYKFSYHTEDDHVYIYGIAGITNDMEAGKYWLFYSQSSDGEEIKHYTTSPDQIIVGKDEHLIMWYKTANI